MADDSCDRHSVIAPAKINLTLQVLGKRRDGYHDIASVATKVTFYDGIDVRTSAGPAIEIKCSDPAVPSDARNLIWQAAQLLAKRVDDPEPISIDLQKRIPIGAGLGGGSSDAAGVLQLLNRRWNLGLQESELLELAARIGSDVAMFLKGPAVSLSGRGEIVRDVVLPWRGWMVLVLPPFGISTAEVYGHWREHVRPPRGDASACLEASIDTAAKLDAVLFNDLQQSVYAIEPRLEEIKNNVERSLHRRFHITGSGSTMFACVDTLEEAERLNQELDRMAVANSRIVKVLTMDDNL